MTRGYIEHPEATEEQLDAVRYYHGERAGLGDDLVERFRVAVRDIVDSPDAWPPVPGWDEDPLIRSRRVGVFPYRVVYYLRGDEVVILAYAHDRRRPGYWRHRI